MSEAWVHSLKVAELKDELKKRGESTTGLKAALAERLLEVIASEAVSSMRAVPSRYPRSRSQEDRAALAAEACAPVAEDATAGVTDEPPKEDAADVEAAADERSAPAEVPAIAKDPAPQDPEMPAVAQHPAPQKPEVPANAKDLAPQEPEVPAVAKDPAPQEPLSGTAQTTALAQQQTASAGQPGSHGMHDAPMNIHALLDDEDGPDEEEPEPKKADKPAKTAADAHADRMDPEEPTAPAEPAQQRSADAESEEAHAGGKRKPLTFAPPERKRSLVAAGGGTDEPAMADPGPAASPDDPAAKKLKVDVVAAGGSEAIEPTEANAVASVRTNILFIDGLMRPFTEGALRQLLSQTGKVTDLWMPGLKTHAVVTFENEEQAEATRTATHQLKWPAGTLKHLMPRFLTAEEAEAEKSGKGKVGDKRVGRSHRWPPAK
eukprot:363759-Chlamydomonas_euryale.AAC.6